MKGCMIHLRVEHFTLSVDCDLEIGAERSTVHYIQQMFLLKLSCQILVHFHEFFLFL